MNRIRRAWPAMLALALLFPWEAPARKSAGLAETPPMGWNSWNTFGCKVDERLIRQIADAMVASGMKEAGYEYIDIDDCWHGGRDADGFIQADPRAFPSGMKALADYVHGKGLKLGIYSDAGNTTCAGRPGSRGHEYQDALTYARWGIDYVKYDWCDTKGLDPASAYATMRDAIHRAGRPMLFSICEWGDNKPWEWAKDVGHAWRTTGDIHPCWNCEHSHGSWSSLGVLPILDKQAGLRQYAGPGHWNDPDMLQVGNGGMTHAEYRSHFSLWAMMAAPLLIGTDLRTISPADLEILLNRDVIAVNQDPLGVQARRIRYRDGVHVLHKPLHDGSIAVALFNEGRRERQVQVDAAELGLQADTRYVLRDLWQHDEHDGDGNLDVSIAAHATVVYRIRAR